MKLLASVLILFSLLPALSYGGEADTNAEAQLFYLINIERERNGLGLLKLSAEISELSRQHSFEMMNTGRIEHVNGAGLGPDARICYGNIFALKVGENLARHVSVKDAHKAILESENHRQTMLDPDFTEIGIGVVRDGESLFITENFILPMELFSRSDATGILLQILNEHRKRNRLPSLKYLDYYEPLLKDNPPLIDSALQILNSDISGHCCGNCLVVSYTTSSIRELPRELAGFAQDSAYTGVGIYVWFEKLPGICEYKYKISIVLSD